MKSFFISIFFSICSLFVLAQSANDSTKYGDKYHISFDLFKLAQGSLQVNYERPVTRRSALCVGFIGTWSQSTGLAKIYLKAQDFDMKSSSGQTITNVDKTQVVGAGINLKYKVYLGKNPTAMTGWWWSPELFYRQLKITGEYTENSQIMQASKTLYLSYLGYAVGRQSTLFKVLCVDYYAGGGFFFSQYKGESFHTTDRANYQLDYTGVYLNGSIAIGFVK